MPFKINDHVQGTVYLEGKEIFLREVNSLHELHISSSTSQALPLLVLKFTDMLNLIPNMGLIDGAKLTVVIEAEKIYTRQFRVHKWRSSPINDGFGYYIEAYWDSPMYWMGVPKACYEGTSSAALNKIAEDCGLTAYKKNTSTADSMIWVPGNRNYNSWASSIASAGYVSDDSHMVLAVDDHGNLRYLDVNSLPSSNTLFSFEDPKENGVKVTDYKMTIKSGLLNAVAGYRHTKYVQEPEADEHTELSYTPQVNTPQINSTVRTSVPRSGISYAPIGWGTVHDRYERARYQNQRYHSLKSTEGEFLCPYPNPLCLLDNFKFRAPKSDEDDQADSEWSIKTKIIYISGSNYFEKIIAINQGLN